MAYYEVNKETKFDTAKLKGAFETALAEKRINGDAKMLAEELVQVVLDNTESDEVRIFGPGHKVRLSEQWGIEHTYSVPLMEKIAANGDSGTPYILEYPDSSQAKIYKQLATAVVSEVAKTKFSQRRPEITYDKDRHLIHVDEESMSPANLRRACRCAACVEEMTGRQILLPTSVSESIQPVRLSSTGNYALSVDWSDGHRSLYPYRQIRSLLVESKRKELSLQEA